MKGIARWNKHKRTSVKLLRVKKKLHSFSFLGSAKRDQRFGMDESIIISIINYNNIQIFHYLNGLLLSSISTLQSKSLCTSLCTINSLGIKVPLSLEQTSTSSYLLKYYYQSNWFNLSNISIPTTTIPTTIQSNIQWILSDNGPIIWAYSNLNPHWILCIQNNDTYNNNDEWNVNIATIEDINDFRILSCFDNILLLVARDAPHLPLSTTTTTTPGEFNLDPANARQMDATQLASLLDCAQQQNEHEQGARWALRALDSGLNVVASPVKIPQWLLTSALCVARAPSRTITLVGTSWGSVVVLDREGNPLRAHIVAPGAPVTRVSCNGSGSCIAASCSNGMWYALIASQGTRGPFEWAVPLATGVLTSQGSFFEEIVDTPALLVGLQEHAQCQEDEIRASSSSLAAKRDLFSATARRWGIIQDGSSNNDDNALVILHARGSSNLRDVLQDNHAHPTLHRTFHRNVLSSNLPVDVHMIRDPCSCDAQNRVQLALKAMQTEIRHCLSGGNQLLELESTTDEAIASLIMENQCSQCKLMK